jgi:hypothetical protein
MAGIRTIAATAAVALLAVGCGSGMGTDGLAVEVPPAVATSNPGATPVSPGAPAPPGLECRGVTGGSLPADAAPSAVLDCLPITGHMPGDGEWLFRVDRRATDLERLVAALRLPSKPRTHGGECTTDVRGPVVVLLEVEGRVVPVDPPRDECHHPRPEVIAAYKALHWTETGRTPLQRKRSQAAVADGCEIWKDMLAIDAGTAASRPGGPGAVPTRGELRVCRYRSVYPAGWKPASNVVVDGVPLDGFVPAGGVRDRIVAGLSDAGPAVACDQRHTRFAIVFVGTGQAYVELDGCLRVLAPDGTLRQGTRDLVTLLTSG